MYLQDQALPSQFGLEDVGFVPDFACLPEYFSGVLQFLVILQECHNQ